MSAGVLAAIQSNYIPWKGYFDIIQNADVFVFHDDIQYTKQDWRNRTRIKTAQGLVWLTIPTGLPRGRLICDVELQDHTWQMKHWERILQNYRDAEHFSVYRAFFEEVYTKREWTNLSDLNQFLTKTIATEFLGIRTEFRDSREFDLQGEKQERLIDLVKKSGCHTYISGPAGKDYIEPVRFEEIEVDLVWKAYSAYLEYPQFFPPFEHRTSIIDLLFHTGPEAPGHIEIGSAEKGTASPPS